MNTFVKSLGSQETETHNGMKAYMSTSDAALDLFYKVGGSRGQNIRPLFSKAYAEDANKALRIAQWARDPRGGTGERQLFRDMLLQLEEYNPDHAIAIVKKIPEIGRFDDLLINFKTEKVREAAFTVLVNAIQAGNGLAAKWTPRKGPMAAKLRKFLGWTPKYYRKRLVELTKVVESQMTAKDWDNINFNHVPSKAMTIYKKAFARHTAKYSEWAQKLADKSGDAKVNAGAVYPYEVIRSHGEVGANRQVTLAMWDALPNYMTNASVLPLVDVSASMGDWQYYT